MTSERNDKLSLNKSIVSRFTEEASLGLESLRERAELMLTERYIQHNPFVESGREGFIKFFQEFFTNNPGAWQAAPPPVFMIAEGDLVVAVHKVMRPDPDDPVRQYESFFFDMFRIKDGKLDEHWDSAVKPGTQGGLVT